MIESMAVGPLMWNIDVLFFKSIFRISRKFKLKPFIITGFVSLITANGKASIDSGLIGVINFTLYPNEVKVVARSSE